MVDRNRTRTPKKSALVYKEIIRSRVIDYDYNPNPYKIAFGATKDEKVRRVTNAARRRSCDIFVVLLMVLYNFSA